MIKAVGGFFRTLLLLALLGLVGYNTMELRKLQTEVDLLRARNNHAKSPLIQPANDFAPGWIGEAQSHVERARVLLRAKRYDAARKETQAALAVVQKKAETARAEGASTLERGRTARETVSREATSLWNQINRLTRLPKGADDKTNATPQQKP